MYGEYRFNMHMTAQERREGIKLHRVVMIVPPVTDLLPDMRLRFHRPPVRRAG